jgi:hypothetical protein
MGPTLSALARGEGNDGLEAVAVQTGDNRRALKKIDAKAPLRALGRNGC